MDLWELIGKVRDAVKANETITSWCTTNYGQAHTVYIGMDEENPPADGDYPVIVILPDSQERSVDVDYSGMRLQIGYGIVDATRTEADNVVTYRGVERILTFRATVEGVLFASDTDLGGAWIEDAPELVDSVDAFPHFLSLVDYLFRNPVRLDPLVPR